MIIKYSCRFFLRLRAGYHDKKVRLNMRVTIKGQQPINIPTDCSLYPSQWDVASQSVMGDGMECKEARNTINKYISIIDDIMNRYSIIEKREPDNDELRTLILDTLGRVSIKKELTHTISELFPLYIQETEKRSGIALDTSKHLRTAQHRLLSSIGDKDIVSFKEDDLEKMSQQLIRKGLKNSTIQKNEQMVKQFLRWAYKKGYCNAEWLEDYHSRYKTTTGEKEIIYLTIDEVKQLEQADIRALMDKEDPGALDHWQFSRGQLERCRDVFLFCCYTSLRYSDVANLRWSDINGDVMRIVTQKTTDAISIELNNKAKSILEKYKNERYEGEKALPIVAQQVMNRMLKRLAYLVGLDRTIKKVYYVGATRHNDEYKLYEVISTHCGRRTFVVMALTLGIPAEVIMRWTGHSSYNAMRPYIAIVDELKKEQMKKFDTI